MVEQGRVLGLVCLFVGCGELLFQVSAVGAQFGAALFDIADEVLVEVVGKFEVADEAFALGVGVGDGAAQGLDVAGLLLPCVYRSIIRRRRCDLRFGWMSRLRQDRGLCLFACST